MTQKVYDRDGQKLCPGDKVLLEGEILGISPPDAWSEEPILLLRVEWTPLWKCDRVISVACSVVHVGQPAEDGTFLANITASELEVLRQLRRDRGDTRPISSQLPALPSP